MRTIGEPSTYIHVDDGDDLIFSEAILNLQMRSRGLQPPRAAPPHRCIGSWASLALARSWIGCFAIRCHCLGRMESHSYSRFPTGTRPRWREAARESFRPVADVPALLSADKEDTCAANVEIRWSILCSSGVIAADTASRIIVAMSVAEGIDDFADD